MFCDVLTLNELPEYESPVPAVVVAYDPTSPPYTASDPLDRDESLNGPPNVDDAVENNPPVNPITEDVELPYDADVNGKTPRQLPPIAKQPAVRLKPTFEVEVAWPEIFNPDTVVVPNPVAETVSADDDALVTASRIFPVVPPQIVVLEYGVDVPIPTLFVFPSISRPGEFS